MPEPLVLLTEASDRLTGPAKSCASGALRQKEDLSVDRDRRRVGVPLCIVAVCESARRLRLGFSPFSALVSSWDVER